MCTIPIVAIEYTDGIAISSWKASEEADETDLIVQLFTISGDRST